MSDRELETRIDEHYGSGFNFVAVVECGNDTQHVFTPETDVDADSVLDMHEGNWYGVRVDEILGDMVNNGHLPDGEYLINVSW
jgi:hypothetical protein